MKTSALRILRASAISALTIIIIIVTIVLVAIGRGYVFNFRTGQISGGGLVLLNSEPEGADVVLDGKDLGKDTPQRLSLKAGSYNVGLQKAGFRPWQKNLGVTASEVTWAQYPFLVPEQLKPEKLAEISRPQASYQSPDFKFMAVVVSAPTAHIRLLELGKTELKTIFTLSPEQAAAGISIAKLSWSDDSEHLLIELSQGGQPTHIVLNALNPSEIFDLNRDFGTSFVNLQFSASDWRQLYWQSPEGLRKLDLGNRTISAVLAPSVSQFTVADEAVFFVQNHNGAQQLMRLDRDSQVRTLAASLPVSDYQLAYSLFENKAVVALVDTKLEQMRLFDSHAEHQSIERPFENIAVEHLSIGPDMRYLVLYQGRSFHTYDFEFKRLYRFELPTEQYGPISWFDDYHLLMTLDGQAQLLEFDGANRQPLVPNYGPTASFANRNQELLYSFRQAAGELYQLEVTRLKP